jgi:histidinol-phosphatase (PHP family)
MSLADYHIHTYLCGHATGNPDDYIACALRSNLAEMGFSDHAPLPPGLREGITMTPEQTEEYITLVENLKIKYKDKIPIKTGFEIDFPLHDSLDRKYFTDGRIDYLIGSCHFIDGWAFDHPDNIAEFDRKDINEVYTRYYKIIEDLAGSGYFNIIGHFDLVKKFGHRAVRDFSPVIERLCAAISGSGLAVEINTSGKRKPVGEIYPSDDIIDIFFRKNVPVTLGSDSHCPEEVGYHFDIAAGKLKKAGYRKISGFGKRTRFDITI